MQLREEIRTDKRYCCICGEEIIGYGNNADPVAYGSCCDNCSITYVIPARMEALKGYDFSRH